MSLGQQLLVGVTVAVVGAFATAFATGWADGLFTGERPPSCPGDACDGKDPQTKGCGNDAGTYKPTSGNPVGLQIRYSHECKAVWGKITRGEPGDTVSVTVAGGARRQAEIDYGDDVFTKMVGVPDGAFKVTVCAAPTTAEGRQGRWQAYCVSATDDASDWL